VDVEDPSVDHGRQRDVVEQFCTISPHVDRAVLAQALVVEAIDLGDLPALVVSADQRDPIRVPHLHRFELARTSKISNWEGGGDE
jgi:hypothetical protein